MHDTMTHKEFAEKHTTPEQWRVRDEGLVYAHPHHRFRVICEELNGASRDAGGYVAGLFLDGVEPSDHPTNSQTEFAAGLMALLRDQVSASNIQYLLWACAAELNEWQSAEPDGKRADVCREATSGLAKQDGFRDYISIGFPLQRLRQRIADLELERESFKRTYLAYKNEHLTELAELRAEKDELDKQVADLRGQVKHWQSNHAHQVAAAALLKQREDLPVDRLPAYREMRRLQRLDNKVAELLNANHTGEVSDATTIQSLRLFFVSAHADGEKVAVERSASETQQQLSALIECEQLKAERLGLRARIDDLQVVCAEAYQLAGALGADCRALDNLFAAAHGEAIPHDSFLPVAKLLPDAGRQFVTLTDVIAELERAGMQRTAFDMQGNHLGIWYFHREHLERAIEALGGWGAFIRAYVRAEMSRRGYVGRATRAEEVLHRMMELLSQNRDVHMRGRCYHSGRSGLLESVEFVIHYHGKPDAEMPEGSEIQEWAKQVNSDERLDAFINSLHAELIDKRKGD